MNAIALSRDEAIDLEAESVSELALARGARVACAESLTSGAIASALGRAPRASEWFCGGVIAYSAEVKHDVLGVEPGPVVTELCAGQMASGVRALMAADVAVAVTGVGGPDSAEGHPPGTVVIAVSSARALEVSTHHFDGEPSEVVSRTTLHALAQLRALLES